MRMRNVINGGIPAEDTAQAGGSAARTAARASEPGTRRREAGGHAEAQGGRGSRGAGGTWGAREMEARRPGHRAVGTAATSCRVCRTG